MNNEANTTAQTAVLQANDLYYAYCDKSPKKSKRKAGVAEHKVSILEGLNLTVNANDSVAIVGASGTGKSTLLHVLGGLDTPQSGEVLLCGELFSASKQVSPKQQGLQRNRHLGFVYQFHHLLPEFTALENVMMPLLVRQTDKAEAMQAAQDLLDKVGVGQRGKHKPSELSGGERQRVAIARAMVTKPACILADEPTGNLDQETAQSVMQTLFELQQIEQTALIIVTHDMGIAEHMESVYRLQNRVLNPVR